MVYYIPNSQNTVIHFNQETNKEQCIDAQVRSVRYLQFLFLKKSCIFIFFSTYIFVNIKFLLNCYLISNITANSVGTYQPNLYFSETDKSIIIIQVQSDFLNMLTFTQILDIFCTLMECPKNFNSLNLLPSPFSLLYLQAIGTANYLVVDFLEILWNSF